MRFDRIHTLASMHITPGPAHTDTHVRMHDSGRQISSDGDGANLSEHVESRCVMSFTFTLLAFLEEEYGFDPVVF